MNKQTADTVEKSGEDANVIELASVSKDTQGMPVGGWWEGGMTFWMGVN